MADDSRSSILSPSGSAPRRAAARAAYKNLVTRNGEGRAGASFAFVDSTGGNSAGGESLGKECAHELGENPCTPGFIQAVWQLPHVQHGLERLERKLNLPAQTIDDEHLRGRRHGGGQGREDENVLRALDGFGLGALLLAPLFLGDPAVGLLGVFEREGIDTETSDEVFFGAVNPDLQFSLLSWLQFARLLQRIDPRALSAIERQVCRIDSYNDMRLLGLSPFDVACRSVRSVADHHVTWLDIEVLERFTTPHVGQPRAGELALGQIDLHVESEIGALALRLAHAGRVQQAQPIRTTWQARQRIAKQRVHEVVEPIATVTQALEERDIAHINQARASSMPRGASQRIARGHMTHERSKQHLRVRERSLVDADRAEDARCDIPAFGKQSLEQLPVPLRRSKAWTTCYRRHVDPFRTLCEKKANSLTQMGPRGNQLVMVSTYGVGRRGWLATRSATSRIPSLRLAL